MTITKNENGYYEVRIKGPDGKFKSKSTGKRSRKDAIAFIRESKIEEIEQAAELGILTQDVISILAHGRRVTVENAMPEWIAWLQQRHHSPMTISNSEMWARRWAQEMQVSHRPIISIKVPDIDGWINNPKRATKAGTRRVMLSVVRSLFNYASGSGMVLGNVASLVRVDLSLMSHEQKEVHQRPSFSDSEVQRMLACTASGGSKESEFWHAAIAIGRWTGLRLTDICTLEWDCLRVPGKLTVWTRKRDKRVELDRYDPPALALAFQNLPMEDDRYLFPVQRLTVLDPTLRATLSTQFTAILEACGIEGKSFHCLRSSYITACTEAGIPMEHIAKSVGHSNIGTTQGYVRASSSLTA